MGSPEISYYCPFCSGAGVLPSDSSCIHCGVDLHDRYFIIQEGFTFGVSHQGEIKARGLKLDKAIGLVTILNQSGMGKMGVYLKEEDKYIGPFHSHKEAEGFLVLMELHGENCCGIEIVNASNSAELLINAISVEERQQLLGKVRPGRSKRQPRQPHRTASIPRKGRNIN